MKNLLAMRTHKPLVTIGVCSLLGLSIAISSSRECFSQNVEGQATVSSTIGSDGQGAIIVEAHGRLPELPVLFTAQSTADAFIGTDRIEQSVDIAITVIQGDAKTLSLGLNGKGQITSVQSQAIRSWSIRQTGEERLLDLHLKPDVTKLKATVTVRSEELAFPSAVTLTHIASGDAIGFNSQVKVRYSPAVQGTFDEADGFAPIDSKDQTTSFQTSTGGNLVISLKRNGASPDPIELTNSSLKGEAHDNGKSIQFRFQSTAQIAEPNSELTILSGDAAVSKMPSDTRFLLKLVQSKQGALYKLKFPEAGTFPIELEFVAQLKEPSANTRSMDFTVGAGAVVPITLSGLSENLEFDRDQQSVVPTRSQDAWLGFLPATGRAKLQWKAARTTGDGKLFFTTAARIETNVSAGLLRQEHTIEYNVLQGELDSIRMKLAGPGEILDVRGNNIVNWEVAGTDDDRVLSVTLSQSISKSSRITIRSQTPIGAFPERVEGLRLNPEGAIRHSGFLRISNRGSVRLEPTGLAGLTQLSPDQFPGKPIKARQVYVYRFPAADHTFTVVVDRIQPEVSVAELVLYRLAETDRVIQASIELDIREAPIREWDFQVPADYSIVSVTGAQIADYIPSSDAANGLRNLKVIFAKDVQGRQLVTLNLEKNEAAAAGDWELPRIEHAGAKSVRGDIGIVGVPGFRIAVGEIDFLVEKPLSYFPKPTANLQQAFRIRDQNWSATMKIELLDRSVQSDVFHLYSLSQETVYGSALINYFVTGAPVSEWRIAVPEELANVMVDGQDVRTWRRDGGTLIVSLHQPVLGPYTLLVTFEEKPSATDDTFQAGQIAPMGVQGERGYIQVVSPMQVEVSTTSISDDLLKLDALELPAEFRLLSTAPPLGTWQYTERPFDLKLKVNWFRPGTMVAQVVEFSEANSRVSQDGELVTDVLYYVKTRGQRTLKILLPEEPVRLWEVSVNGQPVTARRADGATLIPLPGNTDPNVPIEVNLRIGKPSVAGFNPVLTLPVVDAPILKTQWNVVGDEQRVLVPAGGTVAPALPVLRPSGFDWVARKGIPPLFVIGIFTGFGIWGSRRAGIIRLLGLVALGIAVFGACATTAMAINDIGRPEPVELSLPILSANEVVELEVADIPLWRANLSGIGLTAIVAGIGVIVWSFTRNGLTRRVISRCGGILLIALGLLAQRDGAPWLFGAIAISVLLLLFLPAAWNWLREIPGTLRNLIQRWKERKKMKETTTETNEGSGSGAITASIVLLAALFASITWPAFADESHEFAAADSISQVWKVSDEDARLTASGTVSVTGTPGDRFLLLRAPAVLTKFEGTGLRLSKRQVPNIGLCYIVTIPHSDEEPAPASTSLSASFEFHLEGIAPTKGVPVPTGHAAVHEIDVEYDQADWQISCPSAVGIDTPSEPDDASHAKILLGHGNAQIFFKPQARDVANEETQFFIEASNLYLPRPGVVDGRHRLHVRPAQGQVRQLQVIVPAGLTVSAVDGPVSSWQFDADNGQLRLQIEPAQSQAFDISVETQRSLDPLPADVSLAPLRVADANGEVGLLAVAFGPDAQPEKSDPTTMSAVNLGDFDSGLLKDERAVLHRVYRYGADGGSLALRVAPVAPEIRLISKQVLSLGDERVVLAVNFLADITRAGLFQLSFPLPDGLEVESLTGAALHHWAELSEGEQRQIILHLNGKTIGKQGFSLTLAGSAPTEVGDWQIPRFELNEATRQTGELVVRPTAGIRLRTVSRQNISETDPRSLGGSGQGALAFRLLQRDWNLILGVEKLDPWITGQVLHEVVLREGQTRSTLIANIHVQNASVRTLQIRLPIDNEDEIRTLRATGETVSDFVRTAPDSDIWEIQFKRRVIGKNQFRIEYERRGDRPNDSETLSPAAMPQARQLSYYVSVRAGGRLEIEHDALPQGWQRLDWNSVPPALHDGGNRTAPAFAFRAVAPANGLTIRAKRHSLANALKLRVAQGSLTTVLSPSGDQLTSVEVTMEVIQRSSLTVGLPEGGELFSIFVNGESVHSIRQGGDSNAWQFYILPGIDDRTASVRFVYSVAGNQLRRLKLTSPQLNVPLENIRWNIVTPKGYELTSSDGNLKQVGQSKQKHYDRDSYLSKITGKRQVQAQHAAQLLEQANQLLNAGEQTKARWALNSVANQYALDAASNEDARVQLENLQTQQAIVGLNTRRQRLYLDNNTSGAVVITNEQLRQAAADNPVLQQDQLNFRPQELSQLLRGNTTEDNAVLQRIAGRLVQHQRTTDPAPQAIIISLPEEGTVYEFSRSVQVAENAPLELDLNFDLKFRLALWQIFLVTALLFLMAGLLAVTLTKKVADETGISAVE